MASKRRFSLGHVLRVALSVYLGVFVGLCAVWGINLGRHVGRLNELAKEMPTELNLEEMDGLLEWVRQAAGEVEAINMQLRPLFPVLEALEGVPKVGAYLGQVEPVLTYLDSLGQAGNDIARSLEPMVDDPAGEREVSALEGASQVLMGGQEGFAEASQAIGRARQVRSEIDPELLPGEVGRLFLQLDSKIDMLDKGLQVLMRLPEVLGNGGETSYLLVAQNKDELRATGGFITGIGLLSIDDGKVTRFELGDSYLVDDFSKTYPSPPEPLKRFMLAGYWVTRDANWSPDFPTAAMEVQSLYKLSTGVETEGVIAFNQLAVEGLLRVLGPVEVPGVDVPVSAENVEQYMWEAKDATPQEKRWFHRKDFMQPLSTAMLEKALTISSQEKLMELGKALLTLVEEGQVLVYFNDPEVEAMLYDYGLDGAVRPGEGDYLYLVDSNVGFNKTDALIQRELAYQVDLSDIQHPMAQVRLDYQNMASEDVPCRQTAKGSGGTYQALQQSCYLDYWRVYVPGGSEFIGSTAQPVPGEELLSGEEWDGKVESLDGEGGTRVFAGLVMVPIGKSSQIITSYQLPGQIIKSISAEEMEYVIRVQVQPGIDGLPFQVEIKIPEHTNVIDQAAGWQLTGARTWTWQGVLHQATALSLTMQISR